MKAIAFASGIMTLAATASGQSGLLTFGFTDLSLDTSGSLNQLSDSMSLGTVGDVTFAVTDDSGLVPTSSITAAFDNANASFSFDFDAASGTIEITDVDGDVITIEVGGAIDAMFSTEFAIRSISYADNGDGNGDGTFDGSNGGSFSAVGLVFDGASNVGGAVGLLPGQGAPASLPRLVQGFAAVQVPTPGSIALGAVSLVLLGSNRRR